MVVNFTPNIGLAKPTEAEVAEDWVNVQKWQDDNNLIIIDKMDVNLISYTPNIIATTTPPTFGAGSAKAEYYDLQKLVCGNFIIEFINPGLTAGSGEYGISLPFPVDSSFHTVGTSLTHITGEPSCVGEGYAYDASNANASGLFALDVVTISGTSYLRMVTEIYTIPGKTSRVISSGQIFVPDDGDRLVGNFCYKRV